MKRCLILTLAMTLALSALSALAAASGDADVTRYTYAVEPIFQNYCYTLYVKTDNPDPASFRLVDKDSVYCKGGKATWKNRDALFADVKYEDPAAYRVNGGYIFVPDYNYSDGGDLILQQRRQTKYYSYEDHAYVSYSTYVDTDIVVNCPKLIDDLDGAIALYTRSDMDFFEKLDAMQKGLEGDAVYPRTLLDTDAPNADRPYPMLSLAYYQDLDVNTHLDSMYGDHPGGLLIMWAYPFVLDSSSFPNLMAAAARTFDPDCTIQSTSYHYMRRIIHDGEKRVYGGAGTGSTTPLYSNRVTVNYTFDGTSGDLACSDDLESLRTRIVAYEEIALNDAVADKATITGDAYKTAIRDAGGAWLRIGQEGKAIGTVVFIYAYPLSSYTDHLENCWVDGRYVDSRGMLTLGETLDKHPCAGIVERKKTVTYDGQTYTRDVLYTYDGASDTWKGSWYGWFTRGLANPPSFTLTRSQVEAMGVDANTFKFPAEGLIYDGTAAPGTPFQGGTLTYLANNGEPESPATKKLAPIDIGVAVKLGENPDFAAPASAQGMKFKAWRIDGAEYVVGETVIPAGDITAEAVWHNFSAEETSDGAGVQVYVGCVQGFSGRVYCVFYNYNDQCISVGSAALNGGDNDVTFSKPRTHASKAKVIVVDSDLVPEITGNVWF